MNFAEKFKEARKAAGLTQQGLQDKTGIPRRTAQDWEAGKMEPPEWGQNLVLEKLERLKTEKE